MFAWSSPALSSDCPDLQLPDAQERLFCDQFREILYSPYDPKADRGSGNKNQQIGRILNSDPLWGEVYRSDPKQTLDLIQRIRTAGGLKNP